MKLKLADWLCICGDTLQIADVIAQLLAFPRQSYAGYLNPDVFVLDFPDDEDDLRFGTLRIVKTPQGFSEEYSPVKPRFDETDDIFVTGLMLYRLLAGRVADLTAAQFLLINARGDQRVPLLRVPDSSFSDLVGEMTDLNPNTRITREGVLDRLAALYPGTAVVRIIVEESQTELERIRLTLSHGNTLWQPAAHLRYSGLVFQPRSARPLSIPYRVLPQEYICPVAPQLFPMPNITGLHLQQWEPCFALDIGHSVIRLSRLIPGKKPELLPPVPTVMAFETADYPVFGKDALELAAKGETELIDCLHMPGRELPPPRTIKAANGEPLRISQQKIVKLTMKHILSDFQELGYEENSPAVLTMSSGHTASVRSLWLRAAHEAGFRAVLTASPAPVLLYERLYENMIGNVLVVDSGSGSTDVCVLPCGGGLTPAQIAEHGNIWNHCYPAPGGSEMTEVLVNNILQKLNLQHGLALYRQEDTGLTPAQYASVRRRIWVAAEQIKRSLSFTEQSDVTLEIYQTDGTPMRVIIRYSRQQLLNLLEPLSRKIRQALQQACTDRNITPDLIQTVLITGSASISPMVRQTLDTFLSESHCNKVYLDHAGAVIRGASFFAALCEREEENAELTLGEMPYDLGIITADPVRALPLFRTILKAGTPMPAGKVQCDYECEVTLSDLDDQGNIHLRLYSRPKGMEHIQSTLEPEGGRIRYMGAVELPLPPHFKLDEDHLRLHLTVALDDSINVLADHLVPKNRLFSKKGTMSTAERALEAEFHPVI